MNIHASHFPKRAGALGALEHTVNVWVDSICAGSAVNHSRRTRALGELIQEAHHATGRVRRRSRGRRLPVLALAEILLRCRNYHLANLGYDGDFQ